MVDDLRMELVLALSARASALRRMNLLSRCLRRIGYRMVRQFTVRTRNQLRSAFLNGKLVHAERSPQALKRYIPLAGG